MAKELPEKHTRKKKPAVEEAPNLLKENVVRVLTFPWRLLCWLGRSIKLFWLGSWWRKAILVIIGLILALFISSYAVYAWYRSTNNDKPLELGVTYIADYASSLGLQPQETYLAILNDRIKGGATGFENAGKGEKECK